MSTSSRMLLSTAVIMAAHLVDQLVGILPGQVSEIATVLSERRSHQFFLNAESHPVIDKLHLITRPETKTPAHTQRNRNLALTGNFSTCHTRLPVRKKSLPYRAVRISSCDLERW